MSLETHFTIILGGVLLGGLYGLVALGLTMVFGVSRILNVAHGDFVILGSIFALVASIFSGLSPFLILPVVPPVFFALGVLFERTMVRKVIMRNTQNILAVAILATLSFSMIVEDLSFYGLGQASLNYVNIQIFLQPINIMGFIIPTTRFISLIAMIALALASRFIIQSTGFGRRLRATMQDRELAEIVGVNVSRMSSLSFGFGAALAGISGVFLAMITSLTPFQGLQFTVTALTIVILGGLGSFVGAIVGGLVIGLAEAYTAFFVGTNWARIVAVIVMIVVLVVRPSGIFGGRR
ncbi:High-affinity branched-chain amino acid transport system permease protein LivH [archaeon HR01]|nr:High-affinity branched-chain amino acid transport system permease protein LivH [archaeon HR01]